MNPEDIQKEELELVLTKLERRHELFFNVKAPLLKASRSTGKVLLHIVGVPLYLLTVIVRGFTWSITKVKTRRYDPEKRVCPGCGFKGDSGTNKKTCRIKFVLTKGNERASIEHVCFRCGAVQYSPLFIPADKWIARI